MKRKLLLVFGFWILAFGVIVPIAIGQHFGKNKVTQKEFEWLIHKTEHFDIHYYENESRLVPIMAEIAEEAYERHSEDFGHEIKDRTPLILYQSHTDFRDTNIILEELSEGVGGFAEIFKRRIVIPYTGSMRAFREVIYHELVHIFQYDIIYQKPVARIYSGEFLYSAPIWFTEGTADYFAEDIDPIGEMVLRDACLENRLVPLIYLQDFRALGPQVYLGYKMGQSAIAYLVKTYGREKIGELMHELRQSRTKDLNESFRAVLDITIEEFDRDWQRSLKKRYWPMMADKNFPDAIAKNLTEESKYSHSIKPIWSPSGDLIAYITGNDGFGEIVLVSAKTGETFLRVSKEFFRNSYEEIRTEGSGLAWSPDGDRITFFATHKSKLYFIEIDIISEKLRNRIELDFDAVHSPNYNPDGDQLIFAGLKNGQTDLFILDLKAKKIDYLTRDPFDDNSPSWHPKKDQIVYSSERNGKNRLVILDLADRTTREISQDGFNAIQPKWTNDGEKILFSADLLNVFDLYTISPNGENLTRLTSILTGVTSASFSPNEKKIVFGGYQQAKQDIYVMNTDQISTEKIDLPAEVSEPLAAIPNLPPSSRRIAKRKYEVDLGVDAIFTDFQLGSDGLLRNMTEIIASDMMGNHRFGLSVVNQSSYLAPDFVASYTYLTKQADFGAAIFNYHEYHLLGSITNRRGVLQRITGITGFASYPFNRYKRIDLQTEIYTTPFNYNYSISESIDPFQRGLLVLGSISFVNDTTMWREFGPYTGNRYNLTLEKSFKQIGSDLDLTNLIFDARRYFKVGRRSTFATRLLIGGSFGEDHSLFYIGGIDTIRGFQYEQLSGTRIGLLNFEMRIPFIDELRFGWPFAWSIGGIRGIMFADFGTAWSEDQFRDRKFQPWMRDGNSIQLADVKGSIGIGMRLQLGFFSLDFDLARRTDLQKIDSEIVYHFGLGQAF